MKSLKDIEQITAEELEAISLDEKIVVPHDLGYKIQIAAAIAVIFTGMSILNNEPKDTFDNPYMAYAELEKAFATMSEGIKKGMDMVEASESVIRKSTEIFK